MPHLDEGLLSALLDGELSSLDQREVENHLLTCAECAARLAELRGIMSEADELVEVLVVPDLPVGGVSGGKRPWYQNRNLAWAASIVVALGLGIAGTTTVFRSQDKNFRVGGTGLAIESRPEQDAARNSMPAAQDSGPLPPGRDAGRALASQGAPSPTPPSEGERRQYAPPAAAEEATARAEISANQSAQPVSPTVTAGLRDREVEDLADSTAADRLDRRRTDEVAGINPREPTAKARQGVDQPATPAPAAGAGAVGAFAESMARREARAVRLAEGDARMFRSVTMEEAVRQLGGVIRLIDGLAPEEFEVTAADSTQPIVRVLYRVGAAESRLYLEQRRLFNSFVASDLQASESSIITSVAGNRLSWNDLNGFNLTLIGPFAPDSLFHFKTLVK